jgi:hypothetical protein
MATPNIRIEQARVRIAGRWPTQNIKYYQARVRAIVNFPTTGVAVTQGRVRILGKGATQNVKITQARLLVVVRKAGGSKRMRAWGFSLDGHEFYVLRLGITKTLVYDLTTQTWAEWETDGMDFWRPGRGLTWLGMTGATLGTSTSTRVVAGDGVVGQLWSIDPEQGYDEDITSGDPVEFERVAIGGVPMRLRETQRVGAVYLTASFGSPTVSAPTLNLQTSDNFGKSWQDHGTITANVGEYDQEFVWRSLGLIKAPGRIFKITDNGATVRIDGLDMR